MQNDDGNVVVTAAGCDGEGLVEMFAAYQEFSTDRYERRLNQEIAGLRLEMLTAVLSYMLREH